MKTSLSIPPGEQRSIYDVATCLLIAATVVAAWFFVIVRIEGVGKDGQIEDHMKVLPIENATRVTPIQSPGFDAAPFDIQQQDKHSKPSKHVHVSMNAHR